MEQNNLKIKLISEIKIIIGFRFKLIPFHL